MPAETSFESKRSRSRSPVPQSEINPAKKQREKRRRKTGWDTSDSISTSPASDIISPTQHIASKDISAFSSPATPNLSTTLSSQSPLDTSGTIQSLFTSNSTALAYQKRALCRIYVGSLDYYLTADEVKRVFEAFGTIVTIDMPREGDRSKGFCFVEFVTPESADMALSSMQGFLLKGRNIKVGRPSASGLPLPPPLTAVSPAISPFTASQQNIQASIEYSHQSISPSQAGALAAAAMMTSNIPKKPSGDLINDPVSNSNDPQGQPLTTQQISPPTSIPNTDPNMPSASRIYVGNVPSDWAAPDLEKIFSVFGKILSCYLLPHTETPGMHRGYGFIDFTEPAHAKLAIDTMNGFQVVDKHLKVNYAATVRQQMILNAATTANPLARPVVPIAPSPINGFKDLPPPPSGSGANLTPLGSSNPPIPSISPISNQLPNVSPPLGNMIPPPPNGPIPSSTSPQAIQYPPPPQPPAYSHNPQIPVPPFSSPQIIPPPIPPTTLPPMAPPNYAYPPPSIGYKKIQLSNMVDPSQVNDELKNEIRTECLNYGQVLEVDVKIINNAAEVYVTFSTESEAARALPALNGRWFDGNQIIGRLIP